MQVGTPLIAPDGFRSLLKGNVYYLVRNHLPSGRVMLAWFTSVKHLSVNLIMLTNRQFEQATADGFIVPADKPTGLPPHLDDLENVDLQLLDQPRPDKKIPNKARVEDRLLAIAPLLEREAEILSAPAPEKLIHAYAKSVGKNPSRLRFWFFTYITFGRNAWALLPNFKNIGRWDRLANQKSEFKLGRPSEVLGKRSGTRAKKQMIDLIVQSYTKHCALGVKLRKVYQLAMQHDFGGKPVRLPTGHLTFVGVDLPTYDQYRYYVIKHYGLETVQRTLYGESRHRRRYAAYAGSFTAAVGSLYEATESDGYVCEDRPKAYIDGGVLDALYVVRNVDTASGLRLGIGFSFGAEHSEAYNAMHFCSAIPKKKFCKLFDIDIEEYEWPSIGLTPRHITDRGPGVKREPGEPNERSDALAIRELTPSGKGQSKALVESSQRRRTKSEGPQTQRISDLTVYQMAQREIRRLLFENQGADVSGHMTPEMIRTGVHPNPVGLWKFLDDRARNLAEMCSFSDAVRRFLPRIDLRLDRGGALLGHQRYDSEALRQTRILDRVGQNGSKTVIGYILPFCIRHIWADIDGVLVELDAVLKLRDDEEQLYRTFYDLGDESKALKDSRSLQLEHRDAAAVQQMRAFHDDTGKDWDSKKRRSHRNTSTNASKQDNDDVKRLTGRKAYV